MSPAYLDILDVRAFPQGSGCGKPLLPLYPPQRKNASGTVPEAFVVAVDETRYFPADSRSRSAAAPSRSRRSTVAVTAAGTEAARASGAVSRAKAPAICA